MNDLDLIADAITHTTGRAFKIASQHRIGGGCIHRASCVSDGSRKYFVKANSNQFADAFAAESAGLQALAASTTIRVPAVIAQWHNNAQAFLVLEFIESGRPTSSGWQTLGEQLAALHAQPQAAFGWYRDNYIGATPQPNAKSDDWRTFFKTQRLEHQFKLCRAQGIVFKHTERLLQALTDILAAHRPIPSLLHGDLWSGNVAFDEQGRPFIFDPACYHGDRETDLAFTEFFGGFPPEFYAAYRHVLPLDEGYTVRKDFYNLYHCLNHAVLFGGSYVNQANGIIRRLVS